MAKLINNDDTLRHYLPNVFATVKGEVSLFDKVKVDIDIAEGSGRASTKERIHFLEIAYGSLLEVYNQFVIAEDLNYIPKGMLEELKPQFTEIAKMLSGWRKNLKSQI